MEHSTDGESFSLRTVQKIYQCIFSWPDRRNTAFLVSGACHGFVFASVPEGEEEKKMQKIYLFPAPSSPDRGTVCKRPKKTLRSTQQSFFFPNLAQTFLSLSPAVRKCNRPPISPFSFLAAHNSVPPFVPTKIFFFYLRGGNTARGVRYSTVCSATKWTLPKALRNKSSFHLAMEYTVHTSSSSRLLTDLQSH